MKILKSVALNLTIQFCLLLLFPQIFCCAKILREPWKRGGVLCAYFTRTSPPRRNATFCQPPANMQVAMTLRSVAPFPTNLLLRKIFAGALNIFGVLCAYFTRTSPPLFRQGAAYETQVFLQPMNSDFVAWIGDRSPWIDTEWRHEWFTIRKTAPSPVSMKELNSL